TITDTVATSVAAEKPPAKPPHFLKDPEHKRERAAPHPCLRIDLGTLEPVQLALELRHRDGPMFSPLKNLPFGRRASLAHPEQLVSKALDLADQPPELLALGEQRLPHRILDGAVQANGGAV